MHIGNKIYELRKRENMSQEQLAEKINVTRQTISNWETNQTIPDLYQALELTKYFKICLDELVGNEEFTYDNNVDKIWQDTIEIIKGKISTLFYETWIESLELVEINDNSITLLVERKLHLNFVKNHYEKLILDTINKITKYEIKEINYKIKDIY